MGDFPIQKEAKGRRLRVKNKIREFYALEQLSSGHTWVHKLHPTIKLLTTAVFVIVSVSFNRYSFGRLIPYIFYPTLLMAFSETPYAMLLKRFFAALPFCLFAGAGNIIFDRAAVLEIGGVTISYGVVSLLTILFKAYLCVMAILLLVSVTPFAEITASMRRLKIPAVFVTLLEMTYRYTSVLFEEAYSMYVAYSLRGGGVKGIAIQNMGSFVGQLLLRSFDRAERVYNAMQCRGYALRSFPQRSRELHRQDWIFGAVTCFLCAAFRLIDANALLIRVFGGLA